MKKEKYSKYDSDRKKREIRDARRNKAAEHEYVLRQNFKIAKEAKK